MSLTFSKRKTIWQYICLMKRFSLVKWTRLFFFFKVFPFFSFVEMTIKFNQDMYAKMRAKKNEPLSALGKRVVRIVDQGSLATPVATVARPTRVASPTTSVEEITTLRKKAHVVDKGNEKASL